MGGDPAVGKDKSLHIFARNRRNEEREFHYNEGGFVEARMFTVRRDDRVDHPANYGNRDRDDYPATTWTTIGMPALHITATAIGRTGIALESSAVITAC